MNEFVEEMVSSLSTALQNAQERKLVDLIIEVYNGGYKSYQEYYEVYRTLERRYRIDVENFSKPGRYTLNVPVPPAPLLSEELFNYILEVKQNARE